MLIHNQSFCLLGVISYVQIYTKDGLLGFRRRIKEECNKQTCYQIETLLKDWQRTQDIRYSLLDRIRLGDGLRQIFKAFPPFLYGDSGAEEFEPDCHYRAESKRRAIGRNLKLFRKAARLNFWNLETMRREEAAATIYVLKGDQFQVNYNLDGDNGADNSVRVLMVYLMPEFQGNYWVMLKAIRAAYDVLLHNGRTSMNGRCITEEEHDYPFAKGGNAQKMLSEGLTGAGNRLQKAYANTGAIHMGDNEMFGFTPEGLEQILNRMEDSNEARLYARELFLNFLKTPRTIHTQDERNEMIEMVGSIK